MATIHDEIDNWLAANVHDQLSEEERNALHVHLVECVACRRAHQENKVMNKILEDTLATERPDPAFEQRMVGRFRKRVPEKTSIAKLIVGLMHLRALQIAGTAAILLVLVQIGRMLTGEASRPSPAYQVASATSDLSAVPKNERAVPMRGASRYASPSDNKVDIATSSQSAGSSLAGSVAATAAPQARPEFHEGTVAAAPVAKGAAVENKTENPTQAAAESPETAAPAPIPSELANRKLIRNANVEIEIASFDKAVQKITAFANEDHGYIATTSSEKQESKYCRKIWIVFCKRFAAWAS
jgi:anti-sigma factor RsiW